MVRSKCRNVDTVMASTAALQFGQLLYTSLIETGAVGPAVQAIVSPLSVWFALLLLLNGAGVPSDNYSQLFKLVVGNSSSASSTDLTAFNGRAAMLQGLLADQSSSANKLVIANALWTKGVTLNPTYVSRMKLLFGAEVASVRSAEPINEWAAKVTNNLIPQVVSPSLNFNMVITNAVYFKGLWEHPFDKARTQKKNFTALTAEGTKVVQVPMMTRVMDPAQLQRGAQKVMYAEVPGKYRAVRLPYKGSSGLAAVLVLPDASTYTTVFDAAADITAAAIMDRKGWSRLLDGLVLSLPRFKVSVQQLKLNKVLQSLGVTAAFKASQADFSNLSNSTLFVSDVLQSAVVQVDETGTEAAAVTSVITLKSAFTPPARASLVFDRPFLFFLVEGSTQSVLFQGAVTDPTAGGA